MTFSLLAKVQEELRRKRTRSLVSKNTLWPSQASVVGVNGDIIGRCLRASYYTKTGESETNPVSDSVVAMGYMGTKIEDGLIELLKNQGLWEANNIKWQAYGISGEVDILIRTLDTTVSPPQEKKYVVECKSCSGYYVNKELFGYGQGTGANRVYIKGKPKDKHLLQSVLYAHVARETGFEGTILFYVSRDESKMTEFLVTVNDNGDIFINGEIETRFKVQDILLRYEVLQSAIDAKALPDRDYKPSYTDAEVAHFYDTKLISKAAHDNHNSRKALYCDTECNYCEFKLLCLDQKVIPQNQTENLFKTTELPSNSEVPDYIAFGSF
jgi:hypothetical protein